MGLGLGGGGGAASMGGGFEWADLSTGLGLRSELKGALGGWNRSVMLPINEEAFNMAVSTEWMSRYWRLSFGLSALYLLLIYAGQRWMENRPRFELRTPLVCWNVFLAVFSILGCCRTYPEFFEALRVHGFDFSVCNARYTEITVTAYWAWLFALSKVVELGDTAFIVLRKQELIFLHYYHHVSVLIYTWFSFKEHTAPGRWFIVMNFTVHSFMYSYYAARALRWRFPRWVPMTVTGLQLGQMVMGTFIGLYTWSAKSHGHSCQQTDANIRYSLAMYASYFALFAHFFNRVYYANGKFAKKEKEAKEAAAKAATETEATTRRDGLRLRKAPNAANEAS